MVKVVSLRLGNISSSLIRDNSHPKFSIPNLVQSPDDGTKFGREFIQLLVRKKKWS